MMLGQRTRKIFRTISYVYLTIACVFILVGYISIVYFEGWGKLFEILSPFNVINYIAVILILAPGLVLLYFGAKTPAEEADDFVRSLQKRRLQP
jgi:hypothetical protein